MLPCPKSPPRTVWPEFRSFRQKLLCDLCALSRLNVCPLCFLCSLSVRKIQPAFSILDPPSSSIAALRLCAFTFCALFAAKTFIPWRFRKTTTDNSPLQYSIAPSLQHPIFSSFDAISSPGTPGTPPRLDNPSFLCEPPPVKGEK